MFYILNCINSVYTHSNIGASLQPEENTLFKHMLTDDMSLRARVTQLFSLLQENWTRLQQELVTVQDLQAQTEKMRLVQKDGIPKTGKYLPL